MSTRLRLSRGWNSAAIEPDFSYHANLEATISCALRSRERARQVRGRPDKYATFLAHWRALAAGDFAAARSILAQSVALDLAGRGLW